MMDVSINIEVDASLDDHGVVVDINSGDEESFPYAVFTYADMVDSAIEGYTIVLKMDRQDAIDVDDYHHMLNVAQGLNDAANYIVEKLKGLTVVGY